MTPYENGSASESYPNDRVCPQTQGMPTNASEMGLT